MKKWTMQAGMGLLVAGMLASAVAAPATRAKAPVLLAKGPAKTTTQTVTVARPHQVTGTIESVAADANTLTIVPVQHKKAGASQTIQVPATATITMGKKAVALNSLTAGEKVTVAINGEGAVTSIRVKPGKAPKETPARADAKPM